MKQGKEAQVITAAAEIFLRYGYSRTTMGDIAKAAGMSRPSLYLLFPGKEEIFEAATLHLATRRLAEIRQALDACSGVQHKLTTACQMLLVGVFTLQQTTPDARDMDDLSFPVVRKIYAMFIDYFAAIIADGVAAPPAPPEQIARVLFYSLRGLREVAASADDFSDMIRMHIAMLCTTGLR